MTSKSNPVHVLDKIPLSKMSTLFSGEVLELCAEKFCYHKVVMEFDFSEEILKFLMQSKAFSIKKIYVI